jgi:hydrogenase/urease accessory protein HupE
VNGPGRTKYGSTGDLASFWSIVILLGALASPAMAHPLSQGSLDVLIRRDRVDVRARVTLEEVSVTNMLATRDPLRPPPSGASAEAYEEHAQYLAAHLRLTADGRPLVARVVRVLPPEAGAGKPVSMQAQRVTYELEYRLSGAPAGGLTSATKLELTHTVLTDVQFLPGTTWEATYVVRIGQVDRQASEGLLLVAGKPISFDLDWRSPPAGAPVEGARVDRWRMFVEYLQHGVWHILNGYDHLLFISALVLATRKLWDLLTVVTAFTVAHTITLALAAMNWIHLPERVVEPMIAASIVFVALQNVFWPRQSRGWGRLAVAFFFGLFHGLGFAGGLLEAMQEMPVTSKLLAIAAFSLGVELGHQMIVLPLFTSLKLARQTRADADAKDRLSLVAQRLGSAAVSLAGMFYLFVALRMSLGN